MKTAISLPDDLYIEAEKVQKRKRVSRSEFYAMAIRWFVQQENMSGITEQLNKVYGSISEGVDPRLMTAQLEIIGKDEWK
jgi:metal-responsive CopG/Arc/MetJ family transcriptional regulator